MTEFTFTSPDGQKITVTGPEGSTAEQAFGQLKRAKPDLFTAMQPPRSSSDIGDFFQSIPRGVVGGLTQAASALGQSESLEMGRPEQTAEIPGGEDTTDIIERTLTGQMHKPTSTAGKYGASIGEMVGNPASWVGPGGLAGKAASNVLGGLGAQLGEEATGSGWGRFAGGVAGAAAPRTLLKAISPSTIPEIRQPHVEALRREGIEPMAGDVTGSKRIRHFEEMGDNFAFGMGGSYGANKERVARELTAAGSRYMGETADRITPDVIEQAQDRMGPVFENAANQLPFRLNEDFIVSLEDVAKDMIRWGLPDAEISRITAQFNNILTAFKPRRVSGKDVWEMDGKSYQTLTRADTALSHAMKDQNPNVSHFAKQVRSALDDAVERSVDQAVKNAFSRGTPTGPARAKAIEMAEALRGLKEARRQWFTMLVLSKSVDENGFINPAKLRSNLTNSPDNKLAYAAARTDLQRLARAANMVLTPEKSTGTTERALSTTIPAVIGASAGHLATGEPLSGAAIGAVAGPGTIGRAVNSGPVQSWLKNQRVTPYIEQTPTLPWSMLRAGNEALSPSDSRDVLSK